jgi:hypothetical protein
MDRPHPEPIKHREIGFHDPRPGLQQAQGAMLVLADVEGVLAVSIPDPAVNILHIRYDLSLISLCIVEDLLSELGFHLDNSLMSKLKRALYYFIEENELENLFATRDQDHSTRDVFMRSYRCRTHGCRDERPEYWRKYL